MKRYTTLTIAALFMAAALSFGCSDSGTDETTPPPPTPSIGAEGGACKDDGTCNEGLSCSAETKMCLKTIVVQTCEGEGVCPEGYECKDNKCVSTGPKAGEEGGACLPESKCNGTLICKASVCSKCTADADCDSGKVCSNGACEVKPCPVGMVLIKGGQFQMGSETGDSDEKPVHSVTVLDFCMDEREFTNGDKKLSVFASYSWPQTYSEAKFNTDTQPLIYVNWTEAKAICEKQGKRLPTESEWEYAARGGTQAEYGTKEGAAPTKDNACWSCENNNCKKTTTCNVKSYSQNAFGLYDMSGNVWEWVDADYKPYPESTWTSSCPNCKVLRGGSWGFNYPSYLRAANRINNVPSGRYYDIGFRCAVLPEDSN